MKKYTFPFSYSIILLCCAIFLGACTTKENITYISDEHNELLRPNPGYVQHIRNRSLLQNTENLIGSVSGTMNIWTLQNPTHKALSSMASVWLYVNPILYLTDLGVPFFRSFEQGNTLQMIKAMGIDGLYINPLFGGGYLWTNANRMDSFYEDAVQFEFANDLGSYEDFLQFRALVGQENMLLGSSLLPVATGLGPDFWLATRSIETYKGVYTLLPIPQELWSVLPALEKGEQVRALDEKTILQLKEKNIIPQYIAQDTIAHFERVGWAVTEEILDINGEKQRFAYRYFKTVSRPIMNWNDPSLSAPRIINASILQAIGLQGMALLGVPVIPYLGLAVQERSFSENWKEVDELYLFALEGIGRSVRQFGAWSFEEYYLPLPVLKRALNSVTFALDSVTSPFAEYALLTGNTKLMKMMIAEALALGIPFERLIHAMPAEKGISLYPISLYTPYKENSYINTDIEKSHKEILQKIQEKTKAWKDIIPSNTLEIPFSAPLLAMLSLGYLPEEKLQFEREKYKKIIAGHSLLLFFKAMQPGILLVSGQDFSAPLPLTKKMYEQTGNVWNEELLGRSAFTFQVLPYTNILNRFGIPHSKGVYPELQAQDIAEISFKKEVEKLLALRKKLGIDNSKLIGCFSTNNKTVALLLESEKKELFIVLSNFANESTQILLDTKQFPILSKYIQNSIVEVFPTNKKNVLLAKPITLNAWEGYVIRLRKR